MSKKDEALKLALKRAFQYGVDHWYQADHDSYRENKKADKTLAEFHQFVEKTCAALAEQPAPMIRGDIRDGLVDDEPAQQQEPWPEEPAGHIAGGVQPAQPSKPLTDEQILAANYPDGEENGPTIAAPDFELICFARQIEAKLREKNT